MAARHAAAGQRKMVGPGPSFRSVAATERLCRAACRQSWHGAAEAAIFAQAAYHNFGPVQLGDQIAALDQILHAYPQLDPRRLGWWGWSWGGSFTLYAMTHNDRFRASRGRGSRWPTGRTTTSIYTERYLGSPAVNDDVYRDDSVLNSAANLKGRILLVSGHGAMTMFHLENSIQFIQKTHRSRSALRLAALPAPRPTAIDGSEAMTHLFHPYPEPFSNLSGEPNRDQRSHSRPRPPWAILN